MTRVLELTDAARDQDHVDLLVWQHGSIPDRTAFLVARGRARSRPSSRMPWRSSVPARASSRSRATPPSSGSSRCARPSRIEVLDTVAESVARARVLVPGLRRLGVLATDGTMRAGTYAAASAAAGLELVVPEPEVQREVMAIIYDGVKAGMPVSRERFDAVVAHLRERGAEAVVLGCTELSVLHEDLGVDDPTIVDSIDALARRVIARAGAPLRGH